MGKNNNSDSFDVKESEMIHDHIWRHFELTAKQRVDLFKYYNIFFTGFAASAYHIFDKSNFFLVLIGVAFLLITLAFHLIENRNHSLVNLSRDALKVFEKNRIKKKGYYIFKKDKRTCFSHSASFKILFGLGYCAAIFAIIYGALPMICYIHYIPA